MNKRLKPVLALILTIFMSVSTLSNTYTVSAEGEETVTTEKTTTEDVNEQEEVEDNNVNEEDSSNVEEVTTEEDTSEDVANEQQEQAVEEKLGDASMMEYFLVDSPVVDDSVTENFVLSLNNTEGYSDFSITVKKSDGSTFDLESNEQVDNLVKFSRAFSAEEKGEYLVVSLHYSLNGEKYYLNFSDLGMNVKFGVDQEYTGYDETLPDMTKDISEEEEELNNSVIQVTDVNKASEEVAEGMMAQDFPAVMALIDEDVDTQSNEGITLCLDPGHGGSESGTLNYNGTGLEKDYNLKIAKYCYDELQKYNCKVVMTRSTDKYMTLEERAEYAKQQGAQYLISFHLNASLSHQAYGAEVYYPNTNWRPDISEKGKVMAQAIQNQLVSLGLHDRGIKFRTIDINEYPNAYRYDDNSIADYYGVIRNAKTRGITGLIIEHCCMDNESDFNKYLGSEEKIKQLGVADANGIVAALGLTKVVVNTNPSVTYQTHVQDYGWQEWKNNGEMSGTSGQSKRLEGINIKLQNLSGSVEYQTHVQDIGWQGWKSNGVMSGTSGQSKRLEAIKIKLSGDAANKYDIYYRVHAQDYGWLGWAKNGESAGSEGYSKRLEGIEIKLVKKGGAAPGSISRPFVCKTITYQTHVQNIGWQAEKADGEVSGTSGQSLRLEAIKIKLGSSIDGGLTYATHVQDIGWQSFVSNGQLSGTSGQSKRLEAIKINLTGNATKQYDIYYRVHAQNFGWLGWAKNGQSAGTAGYSYRLEAIQIVLVPKGGNAPGSTTNHYYNKGHAVDDESTVLTKPNTNASKPNTNNTTSDKTPIMGATQTSVAQMVRYYNSKSSGYDTFTGENKKYNGSLAKGGASTIEQFAKIVYEEAKAEGVRAEVVFAQCMLETGFLKYGGDVLPNQYNFAGIGATGAVHGASFENVRVGVRAHVQHLKAYASLDGLTQQCVDPRFNLVARGCAQYVEWLGMKENPKGYGWASAKNYGPNIVNMVRSLLSL
ncbi:N-acetylmuramoyl-L-alanine amidase [Holdemanella biformis]|uniref:N-acetylmuramoyl-L-alanine amidase n=1 Tax=Holdemanella biformis TaxID=1735 RepID=UPI00266643A4|nr:N-acetylmuramoyl-L-alanine amidase [Holdemanella biformis]